MPFGFPPESLFTFTGIPNSEVSIHFQLEGKLIGPWVEELRQLSNTALLGNKTVTLDLK